MSKNKTYLTDVMPIRFQIVESESGRTKVRGEFGRCGVPTLNNRRYSREIMEGQIARLNADAQRRRAFGELDHPNDGATRLQRVSHIITGIEIDKDGIVIGEAEILDTPNGQALKAIIAANCEVGVSSRGTGSVIQREGVDDVQDDFSLKTYDFVADPATRTAYPKVVQEALEEAERVMQEPLSFGALPDDLRLALLDEARELVQQELAGSAEQDDAAVHAAAKSIAAAEVDEARTEMEASHVKAVSEITGRYAQQLAEVSATIKGKAYRAAMDELAQDPTVAGARIAIESIADIVRPFLSPVQESARIAEMRSDLVAARDALLAKDLELAEARADLAASWQSVVRDRIEARMEAVTDGHPKAGAIRAMVGPLHRVESIEELNERLGQILDLVGGAGSTLVASKIDALRKENESLQESLKLAESEIESRDEYAGKTKAIMAQARDALVVERERVEALCSIMPRADRLALAEQILSQSTAKAVKQLVDSAPRQSPPVLAEGNENARERVRRGREQYADEAEASRVSAPSGNPTMGDPDIADFEALAGIQQ